MQMVGAEYNWQTAQQRIFQISTCQLRSLAHSRVVVNRVDRHNRLSQVVVLNNSNKLKQVKDSKVMLH